MFHLLSGRWYKVQAIVFLIEGHIPCDIDHRNSSHVTKVVGPWDFEIYLQSSGTNLSY